MSKSEEHGSRSNIACATKTQAQTEPRHKSQRVSKAKQARETKKRRRGEHLRVEQSTKRIRAEQSAQSRNPT